MKLINKPHFLLLLSLITACNSSNQDDARNLTTLTIKEESFANQVNSSAAFSSVKCVPLATDNETLLSDQITKIVHQDGFFYIADNGVLYRFTEEGILSGKISKKGQGPDEYYGLSDFQIASPDSVWLLSRASQALFLYTWDGELKKKIKFNYWAYKMHLISPDKLCIYIGNEEDENNHYQTRIIDLNTNSTISECLKIDYYKKMYIHVMSANHFVQNKDHKNTYFFSPYDDLIYEISNDSIFPVFKVDMFQKNIPASFFNNEYSDARVWGQALSTKNYAWGGYEFIEGQKEYLYLYKYEDKWHIALISKKTKQSVIDFTSFTEDIKLFGYPVSVYGGFVNEDEFIIPIFPSDIMDYAKEHPDIADKLKESIKYESEDQNPVLLILTVK
jgi:hypothetical protein